MKVKPETVVVATYFNEGFYCCGGSDPDCYCSLAEDPKAEVHISGYDVNYQYRMLTIGFEDFDFAKVLGEILEVNGIKFG